MKSIHEILDNSARKFTHKSAIIFDDLRFSYDELLNKTQFLSNLIQHSDTHLFSCTYRLRAIESENSEN